MAFLVFGANPLYAVTLPWSTTYSGANCSSSWTYDSQPLTCDGLQEYLSSSCNPNYPYGPIPVTSGPNEEILPGTPGYSPGSGIQRHWEGNGDNNVSGGTIIKFDKAYPELWIRFYIRYQAGFTWSGNGPGYNKLLYIHGPSGSTTFNAIPTPVGWDGFRIGDDGPGSNANYMTCSSGCGWLTMMGGSYVSDGKWHEIEIHIKMDTNGSNGIGEYWLDGKKYMSFNNVYYGTGPGWSDFAIGSNENDPNNASGCEAVDFSDVSVSNTGFIGPAVAATSTSTTTTSTTSSSTTSSSTSSSTTSPSTTTSSSTPSSSDTSSSSSQTGTSSQTSAAPSPPTNLTITVQ